MKTIGRGLLAAVLLFVLLVLPAYASAASVTAVTAQASGPVDVGDNIVRFNFTGTITANGPLTVQYKWIRSDGGNNPVQTLQFTQAGTKQVSPTSWQLGKGEQAKSLWEAIQIVYPQPMTSNHANITVPPKSVPVTVTVTVENPSLFWNHWFQGWSGSGNDTPKEVNIGISNLSTSSATLIKGAKLLPGNNTLRLEALVAPGTKVQAWYQVYGSSQMILRIDSSNQDIISQAKAYNFTIIPPQPEKLGGNRSTN